VGICLPGGQRVALRLRLRPARPGPARLVRRQCQQEDPPRRPEDAQRLGPVRYARQRRRVVQRLLRSGVLQEQPGEKPARTGRGREKRPPRRPLGRQRGGVHVGVSGRRRAGFFRRLLRSRRDRIPLREEGPEPIRRQSCCRENSCGRSQAFRRWRARQRNSPRPSARSSPRRDCSPVGHRRRRGFTHLAGRGSPAAAAFQENRLRLWRHLSPA
jgi:hypothetical protein